MIMYNLDYVHVCASSSVHLALRDDVCVSAHAAVTQSDRCSVRARAWRTQRCVSSFQNASLPVQPRLAVSCLTHGPGLMHMEEGKERENRNNNHPGLRVHVCILHRCMMGIQPLD